MVDSAVFPPPRVPAAERTASMQTSASSGAVLVTGICGRLGKHLARVLHRDRRVVGVDRRPFLDKPKDIDHAQVDIRRKKLKDVFRAGDIEAVVHLGVMHDPRASASDHHSWNVAGFTKLLEYVARFQIPKLVVLSSANVYGPQASNPQFFAEDAPLMGGQNFSDIRDLVEVDMLAQSFFWKLPETETVILRPVHILGTVRNAPSNFLRKNPVFTVMGFDPMAQVIHESDVVAAIQLGLRPGIRGIFNVAGSDPVPLSRLIKILGRQRVSVPYSVARMVLRRMWSLRLTTFPPPELDHIRYVCMVDDRRARHVLGFVPQKGLEETVLSVDEGRW
jgi:UDP-glucose 4-epimerase